MRHSALVVLGLETQWRRRGAPTVPSPLVVEGPWTSEAEVPSLVRSMVLALGLSPEVPVQWRHRSSGAPELRHDATCARLCFGAGLQVGAEPNVRLLPEPQALQGAEVRREVWRLLAELRPGLRAKGLLASD